jgi:predicted transcriptional regulator
VSGRPYRGYRVYAYLALARLFHALDLDLQQSDLFDRVPDRIAHPTERVSKEEILHAIRSNSHMTEKVLDYLLAQGFATSARDDRGYDLRITVAGVEHLRRYHALYQEMYARELDGHFRYTGPPGWLR